jgi:hypothetical protein
MPKTRRYWEEKAAEARSEAAKMTIDAHRQLLLRIARSYEQLAARAGEKVGKKRDTDRR